MTFFHVLVEGGADVPAVEEVLIRRFSLVPDAEFRIYPHKGKGKLPPNPMARPEIQQRGLLDQLPAKLRGLAHLPENCVVVVLVDADREDCRDLKARLQTLYAKLPRKPAHVLFRIAVEETESWLVADRDAVKSAYPKANINLLASISPDRVVGAWERLAESLGYKPKDCNGQDKHDWASRIMPYVDLDMPKSPSLRAFIDGIARHVRQTV